MDYLYSCDAIVIFFTLCPSLDIHIEREIIKRVNPGLNFGFKLANSSYRTHFDVHFINADLLV